MSGEQGGALPGAAIAFPLSRCSVFLGASKHSDAVRLLELLAKDTSLPERERRGDGTGCWRARRGVPPWSLGLWWGRARSDSRYDEPGILIDIDVHGRLVGATESSRMRTLCFRSCLRAWRDAVQWNTWRAPF